MTGPRQILHRFCVLLTRATEAIAAILIAAIVIMNLFGVFFRYGLSSPIGWTEEGMRYAVVWATFLGASAAFYRGEHMVLDLFQNSPAWLRWSSHILVLILVGIFCTVVVYQGWPLAWRNWRQVSPTMNLPMFWPYVAVTVGFALILLKTIALLLMPPGYAAASFKDKSVNDDLNPNGT